MKMAKASEKDIDAAGAAMSVLQDISSGYYPKRDGDEGDDFRFDPEDPAHLRKFYDLMNATLDTSPGWPGRVIGGMCYVILYPANKIVDPAADCLELHPRFATLSGETEAQREEVCAAWHALPDELRKDARLTRLYRALGGPRMDDPADADADAAPPSQKPSFETLNQEEIAQVRAFADQQQESGAAFVPSYGEKAAAPTEVASLLSNLARGISTCPCRPLASCHTAQEIDAWWMKHIARQDEFVREQAQRALHLLSADGVEGRKA